MIWKCFFCFVAVVRFSFVLQAQEKIELFSSDPGSQEVVIFSSGISSTISNGEVLHAYSQDSVGNAFSSILLKFKLLDVLTGLNIEKAELFLSYEENPSFPNGQYGNNELIIHRTKTDWDSTSISWSNQPLVTNKNRVITNRVDSLSPDLYGVDITSMFRETISSEEDDFGLMIGLIFEDYGNGVVFASRLHNNILKRPRIEITYSVPDVVCHTLKIDDKNGKDSEIGLLVPNNNYGDSEKLSPYAWTQGGQLNVVRPLIEFRFDSVPSNYSLISAELSLKHNPYYPLDQHNGENGFWIERIVDNWVEHEVTWNNQPATTESNRVYIDRSSHSEQDYIGMDVFPLVSDMLDFPEESFGFMLKLDTESPYRVVILASSDNEDEELHPELELCYSVGTEIPELEQLNEKAFRVSPNPAVNEVFVELDESKNITDVVITALDGKELIIQKMNSGEDNMTISVSKLDPGLYVLSVYSNSEYLGSTKIVVK